MDKYEFIMEYGSQAESVKEFDFQDFELVPGCTSRLWLRYNKTFICQADSSIVKGLGGMICDWYNQANDKQRQEFNIETLNDIGLAPILSMGRQNGVANLIKRIKYLEYWGNKNSPS
jgi:cysteine desulfuration protein SufE